MLSLRFRCLVVLLVFSASFPPGLAQAAPAWDATTRGKARDLYLAEDWTGLENMARELRQPPAPTSDGRWLLGSFYAALDRGSPEDRAAKMTAWEKAVPDSPTRPVAAAKNQIKLAWDARGRGYAGTVTQDGWQDFATRLTETRRTLEAAPGGERCPEWFIAMMTVALGQNWPREEYDRLFEAALDRAPEYYSYYFTKAYFLLPRWHGEPGEWERFAAAAPGLYDPDGGEALYARIAWANSSFYDNLFAESAIEWPRMKQGFLDIEKYYPQSDWNLSNFAKFAVMADDRATAQTLFGRLGDRADPRAFGTVGKLQEARLFARSEEPEAGPAPVVLSPGDGAWVGSVAFSPDGKWLAAGTFEGKVVAWSLPPGEPVWERGLGSGAVLSLAFSPDSTLLAASAGGTNEATPGMLQLVNAADGQPTVAFRKLRGTVSQAKFTPDGQRIVMAGGSRNKKGEAWDWNPATGEAHEIAWASEHTHRLRALSISPSGKTMLTDCNRGLTAWNLQTQETVLDTTGTVFQGWVYALTYSPDGRTAAIATSRERTEPGKIMLLDTAAWEEVKPGIEADTGPVWSLAYTPDGKLLVGGGVDKVVRIWEIATGQELAVYRGHKAQILAVAVSPDGRTIASASADGTVRVWPLPAR